MRPFFLGCIAVIFALGANVRGYDLIKDDSGIYVVTWDPGVIPMKVKLATSPALSDGTSQSGSVVAAMQAWNSYLGTVQFTYQELGAGTYDVENLDNEIVMSDTIGGQAFGEYTLAVTLSYHSGNARVESDILFNTKWTWDSYRGPLAGHVPEDIRRVAIHELGHVLGLDHPDQASPPQSVNAIMNATVSNVDTMQSDDIAGAQSMYASPGFRPSNDNFANAETINVINNFGQASGTNVAATAEAGEPALDADDPGGKTVWWKWTASGNGSVTVATLGSNFDTLLGAYTGNSVNALTQLALNDDVQSGVVRTSSVTFNASVGTTYYFAVDGWGGYAGTIKLNISFSPDGVNYVPAIVTHPSGVTVLVGSGAQFAAEANGFPAPSYRWQRMAMGDGNWVDLSDVGAFSGSGTRTLTILATTAGMNGDQFRCVASNSLGAVVTNAATLVVQAPVEFTSRPLTRTLVVGEAVTFQTVAKGNGVITYVWKKNGQIIPNVSGASLSFSAQLSDQGFYEVLVTDSASSARSFFQVRVASAGLAIAGWGDDTRDGKLRSPVGLTPVLAIDGGTSQSIALKPDGTIVTWGPDGLFGGDFPELAQNADVVAVSAGVGANAILKSDGTVYVWGNRPFSPVDVPVGLNNVIQVEVGNYLAMALKADGSVVAWGNSALSVNNAFRDLRDVVAISVEGTMAMALRSNGTVVTAAGSYTNASIAPPAGLSQVVAIAAGAEHFVALKSDGSVVAWGANYIGQTSVPGNVTSIVAIAAAESYSLALKSDGSVIGWGQQIGAAQVPSWVRGAKAIAAGSCGWALVAPLAPGFDVHPANQSVNAGAFVSLSVKYHGAPTPSVRWKHNGVYLTDSARIYGSNKETLQLSADANSSGQYQAVITNLAGEATSQAATLTVALTPQFVQTPMTRVVSAGQAVTLDATADGAQSYFWTRNGLGLQGGGPTLRLENITEADAGYYVATANNAVGYSRTLFYVRVARENIVKAWGANNQGQTQIPAGLANVVDISAGMAHTLALRSDGTVMAWGANDRGQCTVPAGLTNVVQVSAGAYHSVALKGDGTLVAWGLNDQGQCAIPTGLSNVVFVSAGGAHTVALRSDGRFVTWGSDEYGQTTLPNSVDFNYYVSAGLTHNVAITTSGLRSWGHNDLGQLVNSSFLASLAQAGSGFTVYADTSGYVFNSVGISVRDAAGLSTRETHGLVLRRNGDVVTWGPNVSGERDVPVDVGNVQKVAAGAAHSVVLMSTSAPTIYTQPVSQIVTSGSTITLSVEASAATGYRWLKSGNDLGDSERISGAGTRTLTISNAGESDAANYSVRVTNAWGASTSLSATVQVQPSVLLQGGSTTSSDGAMVLLSVNATGVGPFSYQWYYGLPGDTSNPVPTGTQSTLSVPQGIVQTNYWIRATNAFGFVDSQVIPVGKWRLVDPPFGSAALSAIAFGAGKYVVVGDAMGYSANGTDWEVGQIETGAKLRTVFFDGTKYVAGGVRGQVFVSTNGVSWEKQRSADPGQYDENILTSGAYGNGAAIMVGARGQVMSAPNGAAWNWQSVGASGETIDLLSVAFGAGRFVAVGQNASNYHPRIYTSVNGIAWTPATFSLASSNASYSFRTLEKVFFLGGKFIALGSSEYSNSAAYVLSSLDGINWTTPSFSNVSLKLDQVILGDGQLLSADFRTSSDGLNWSAPHTAVPAYSTSVLGYGNGIYFRMDEGSSLASSPDLATWTTRFGFGIPENVAYGNGRFVALSRERTSYSLDGLTWKTTKLPNYIEYGPVSFGNGLFVSIGTRSDAPSHFTSTDGITWTPRDAEVLGQYGAFAGIRYYGEQWIAWSGGIIFTSPNAVDWTSRFFDPQTGPADIAYGDGRFVGVGSNFAVTSTDGINWTKQAGVAGRFLRKVAFGAGVFVAIDTANTVWSSADGVQWNQRGVFPDYLSAISYGGGRFVINQRSNLITSTDGTHWAVAPGVFAPTVTQNNAPITDFVYAANSLWAVRAGAWMRAPQSTDAPVIVANPSDVLIAGGNSVTLTIAATGAGLTYQWYEGPAGDTSRPVAGANASSFLTPTLSGPSRYWVRVANALGFIDSATVNVRLIEAPVITQQPVDVDYTLDAPANLSVVATGVPTPAYQWYRGRSGDRSQPVASAMSSTLSVPASSASQRYWVRVTNSAGSVDSVSVTSIPWLSRLAISGKLLGGVVAGPDRWVVAGFGNNDFWSETGEVWQSTASPVGGQGGGELVYGNGIYVGVDSDQIGAIWTSTDGSSWRKIFVPSASVQFGHVGYAGGLFFALGSDGQYATSLDGSNWTLRSLDYPVSLYGVAYGNGLFVMAAGNKTYTSTNLATWSEFSVVDTDTRIFSLTFGAGKFVGVGGANQGKIMTSSDGTAWTVRHSYSSNGVYDIAYSGSRFAVSAINHLILSRDGVNWSQVALPNTHQVAAGNGSFLAVGEAAWQSAADLRSGPIISTQPVSQGVTAGQSVTVGVVANGLVPSYQWRRNEVDIPGATAASYIVTNFQAEKAGRYSVVITDTDGSVISDVALLTLVLPPQLLANPQSKTINAGQSTFLEVTVSGDAPAQYAWYKDGLLLPNQTNARLNFTAAQAADAGTYTVVVTNAAGSVTSSPAVLKVDLPPVITQQPVSQSIVAAGPVVFVVHASSETAISYLWQRSTGGMGQWTVVPNDTNYSGQSTNTLTINATLTNNSGDQFRCIVFNVAGSTVSQSASLTVGVAGVSRISAGRYHSLRIDTIGDLYVTGTNTFGQLGTGNATTLTTSQTVAISGQTIVDLAAGAEHSLFLTAAKELWATGKNTTGQLGDGTTTAKSAPVKVAVSVSGISAGFFHSAFLKSDGTLWTVGGNDSGQLGNGTTTDRSTPVQIATDVVDLSVGTRQTFFIKSDGSLWGTGDMNGSGVAVSTPVQIATGVRTVAAGAYHSLFVKTDGTLWVFGYNIFGQLGTGTTTDALAPVQIATDVKRVACGYYHSLFVKTDGSLWGMGYNATGQLGDGATSNRLTPYQMATNVTRAVGSENYTLFLKSDGTLWGTGFNGSGQFGNGGIVTVSVPVQIAAGLILLPAAPLELAATSVAAGRVRLVWQPAADALNYEVWRSVTNDSSTATRIAEGLRWAFYEDANAGSGGAYYWVKAVNSAGSSGFSAVGVGQAGVSQPVQIIEQPQSKTVNAGSNVTFTVVANGTAPITYQWRKGGNVLTNTDNLGGATSATLTIPAVLAGDAGSYDVVVTNAASSVVSTGAQLTVQGSPAIVAVAAGGFHTLLLRDDGTLWTVGYNQYGQLGDGTTVDRGTPVQVATNVTAIAAGSTHTLFIKSDRTLWAMGDNQVGALGDGTLTNRLLPVQIATEVVSVRSFHSASLFLKADGTLWAMGKNEHGQFGLGLSTVGQSYAEPVQIGARVATMAAGIAHTLVISDTGMLTGAGYDLNGALGNGSGPNVQRPDFVPIATNVVVAAAGYYHSAFVKRDGTVWTMGLNSSGQLGDGTTVNKNMPIQVATNGTAVFAGRSTTFILKDDASLWRMGSRDGLSFPGQDVVPTADLADVVSVSDTNTHAVYAQANGTVQTVGTNNYGQLADGTNQGRASRQVVYRGIFTAPSAPSTVSATDGLSSGVVRIVWNGAHGASSYEVWRGTTNNPAGAVRIQQGVPDTIYCDASVALNTVYYFWVRAVNPGGVSALSTPDSGLSTNAVAPAITTNPQSQTVNLGANVTFSVTASGTAPITYRWRKGGNNLTNTGNIVGATSATLTIANALASDVGSYDVVVTNAAGNTVSSAAMLVLASPPFVTGTPASRITGAQGQPLDLVVTATSANGTLSYQWKRNNRPIPGATSATYSIGSFAVTDAGAYTLEITNSYGQIVRATTYVLPGYPATQVRVWGDNGASQLSVPAGLNNAIAVSSGSSFVLALKADGTLVEWGGYDDPQLQPPAGLSDVVAISAGNNHVLALKSDGSVVAWGYNFQGQTSVPAGLSEIIAVSAGDDFSVALGSDGKVVRWGRDANTYPVPAGLTGVTAIAAGSSHVQALKLDGTVVGWGSNYNGLVTTPPGLTNVVGIAAGRNHTLALRADGAVVAWGNNTGGQSTVPAGLTNAVAITAAQNVSFARKTDGTVVAWGNTVSTNGPDVLPNDLGDVLVLASGPTSNNAMVLRDATGDAPPTIITQPVNSTVAPGQPASFTVVVSGTFPSYEWRKDGRKLFDASVYDGAGTAVLTILEAQALNAGSYEVFVSNAAGSVVSASVLMRLVQEISFAPLSDHAISDSPFELSATASSGLPVSFSVMSGPAVIAGTTLSMTGSGTVTLRASQSGDATYAAAPDIERSFTIAANFSSWARGKFTASELLDPAISGPKADPDGDSYSNLLEYALGTEPKTATTSRLPEVGTTATDWTYTYTRPVDRSDVTYSVEVSSTLNSWTTGGVTHELVSSAGGVETWRARMPLTSATSAFFRLKVTQ